ncbi:MAG: carbon-nitrogen hydrolase [Wenzhouxiangellaceae bacterium]
MRGESLTVALVQHAMESDRAANHRASLDGIARAAEHGAELVILPELHASEYFCKYQDPALFDLSEPLDGPTRKALARAAAENGVVVVGSIFEQRAPGLAHNTAIVLERDGSLAGIYRKMHIPDDPGYNEKFYFTPGDLGFEPITTSVGRLGILVCWDQWYPEAARLMTLAGAELLIYPTAIGFDPNDDEDEARRQLDAWRVIQRSHAVANGVAVASCNRVGFEPDRSGAGRDSEFWGHSFIAGPQGEVLAEAGDESELLLAAVDRQRAETVRRIWPYLRDRRIDAYQDLTRRYIDHPEKGNPS